MNFEALPNWTETASLKPMVGKLVVIFRYDHKTYVVGRLEDCEKHGHSWRGESGNLLKINGKDLWMYINPVTITTRYD